MSRDIGVYTKSEKIITPTEFVEALRARGIQADWKPRSPQQPERTSGFFFPAGISDPKSQATVSTESLDEAAALSLVEAYRNRMSQSQREALQEARVEYLFSTVLSPDAECRRLLANLVYVTAEMGDGVIIDMLSNTVLDKDQYRSLSPELFN